MPQKDIFEEVDIKKLKEDLQTVSSKNWSNMTMLELFSNKYHFNKVESTLNTAKPILSSFWQEKVLNPTTISSLKKRAITLNNTVTLALESRPALSIITSNIKMQLKNELKDKLETGAYNELLEVNPANDNIGLGSETDKEGDEQQAGHKRRKYLKLQDLHKRSWETKLLTIADYYGENSVLDLTKNSVIPKRFKTLLENICNHYNLKLELLLKEDEYNILKKISTCNSKEDLYTSVQNIAPFITDSELPFIKMAVQKLCHLWFCNVFTSNHNEDWYRVNVYSDLFDLIFNGQYGYKTKRAECHSLIIKSLKQIGALSNDAKNVRMDFIFSHIHGLSDAFYCEDKPNNNDLKDQKKTKNIRDQSLKYWLSLLPYPECITYITAITCQFRKLNLHITGSKMINDVLVHSLLKEVDIPSTDNKGGSVAEYLATVISVVRMVIRNFEVINIIINIKKEDDLVFLSPLSIPNSCFREDSPNPSDSCSSNSSCDSCDSTSSAACWECKEKKLRVLKKIEDAVSDFMNKNDDYVSFCWEDVVFN